MAIIYTYPKLSNPDGTELIVVSDPSDQNNTKLVAISTIASLVPSSAGGTVTSVALDFNPATGDTGLRLAGGASAQTINTFGTFEVGGKLNADHGGTGQDAYDKGDILYYDATASQLEILTIGNPGDVLTVAAGIPSWAAAGGGGTGTVTSVGTTNAMGVSSGITFVTNPVPITGAGTVDLSFTGAVGDMWYANSVSEVKLLNIGTSTPYAPTGSVINQVLAVDASDPVNPVPSWTTKEILIQNGGADVEAATNTINFTGAGVVASTTGAGTVEVAIEGGGGGGGNMAFSPINVAACDSEMMLNQAVLYLTIAEHDMTIANCTVWGTQSGGSGNIEVAVYRWGGGWGTGVMMGQSGSTVCGYGPTDLTLSASEPENLTVTAGEWIIVGMVDTTEEANWFSASHPGFPDKMFGQVDTLSFPGQLPATTPLFSSEDWAAGEQKFALTLW
tara:strand:+ start:454 stop:1794 length:1341 start_codon:yes stop_codon:yes gene_type:complete